MKTIFRSNPQSQFTVIPNELLQSGLSSSTLGILVRILSLPEHWQVHKSSLKGKDGRKAIDNAFRELEAAGYMRQLKPEARKGGKFQPIVYLFTDKAGHFPDHTLTVVTIATTVSRQRCTDNGKDTAIKKPLERTNKKEIITKKQIEISINKEKEAEPEKLSSYIPKHIQEMYEEMQKLGDDGHDYRPF